MVHLLSRLVSSNLLTYINSKHRTQGIFGVLGSPNKLLDGQSLDAAPNTEDLSRIVSSNMLTNIWTRNTVHKEFFKVFFRPSKLFNLIYTPQRSVSWCNTRHTRAFSLFPQNCKLQGTGNSVHNEFLKSLVTLRNYLILYTLQWFTIQFSQIC